MANMMEVIFRFSSRRISTYKHQLFIALPKNQWEA